MTKQRFEELSKMNIFDQKWLEDVYLNFKPKTNGKIKTEIYDIEDLDDEIENGILLETAYCDTQKDLENIFDFFEGNVYCWRDSKTDEIISKGFIDGTLLEESMLEDE